MRIRISHATSYHYDREVRSILQMLRVTPRPHEGQQVIEWRLDADADVRLRWTADPLATIVHSLSTKRPVSERTVTASAEIVTTETAGVVRGAVERLPEEVYLRSTPRTHADARLAGFARDVDPGPDAGDLA